MVPTVPMWASMMAHARDKPIGRNTRMHMALKTHRWTRADLERMPDDGNRYEVIRGELLVSPAPRPAHVYIQDELLRVLIPYCATLDLAVSQAGAFVDQDSETIPDTIVRTRLTPPPVGWEAAPIPVLVIEVLSDSTKRRDELKKRAFYMEAGIPEYWIVDGDTRSIRVITSAGDHTETSMIRWLPAGASQPFVMDIRAFFSRAIGPA
jgi:Uma2 family endonuclease